MCTKITSLNEYITYSLSACFVIMQNEEMHGQHRELHHVCSSGIMSSRGGKKKISKTSRSARAGVIFPVGRMLRYIKRGLPKYRIGVGAPVYMAAVLEYLTGTMHL